MFSPNLFFVLIAIVLIEAILSGMWLPTYFRSGIRLFRKTIAYSEEPHTRLDPEELSRRFQRSVAPSLVFREFNGSEIGFRERLFQLCLFQYTPIMHGLISIDRGKRVVSVTGYVNWSILVFPIFVFLIDPELAVIASVFMIAVIGVIYAYQAQLYRKVVTYIGETYGIAGLRYPVP